MRSVVVLPQPDGPTSAPTSLWRCVKARSRKMSSRPPDAAVNALRVMRTLRGPGSPAGRASFKGLHQEGFDRENDDNECQRIGKDARHVKQLEGDADLEADAVRPAEQFDDEHDLPDQRQAGARRRRDIGRKLRQYDMPQLAPY